MYVDECYLGYIGKCMGCFWWVVESFKDNFEVFRVYNK